MALYIALVALNGVDLTLRYYGRSSKREMAKTEQLTDIEIAKQIVKKQKEDREGNYNEFKERQEVVKERRDDWQERLKQAGHI